MTDLSLGKNIIPLLHRKFGVPATAENLSKFERQLTLGYDIGQDHVFHQKSAIATPLTALNGAFSLFERKSNVNSGPHVLDIDYVSTVHFNNVDLAIINNDSVVANVGFSILYNVSKLDNTASVQFYVEEFLTSQPVPANGNYHASFSIDRSMSARLFSITPGVILKMDNIQLGYVTDNDTNLNLHANVDFDFTLNNDFYPANEDLP